MIEVKALIIVSPECADEKDSIENFFSTPTSDFVIKPTVILSSRPKGKDVQRYDYVVLIVKRHETEATLEKGSAARSEHYADAIVWAYSCGYISERFYEAVIDDTYETPTMRHRCRHDGKIDDLLPHIRATIYQASQKWEQE